MLEADAIAWSKIMCRKGKMAHGQSGVTSLQQFQNALPQKTYGTVNIGQNVYQSGGEKSRLLESLLFFIIVAVYFLKLFVYA